MPHSVHERMYRIGWRRTVFSTLDENFEYWKDYVAEEERDKTAFTYQYGLSCSLPFPPD